MSADTSQLPESPGAETRRRQMEASHPRTSAWVSANAGAGKTHVLTNRVARLLLDQADPAAILCLTFTKAAAAEMSERLIARLGTWSLMPDGRLQAELSDLEGREIAAEELARARRLFARALETPGGLKIQTVHAFCQSLLGRFPLEAGLSPAFTVLDDREAAELLRQARHAVFTAARRDRRLAETVRFLATTLNDGDLEKICAESVSARPVLLSRAQALIRKALGVNPEESPEGVCAAAMGEAALLWGRVAAALRTGTAKEQTTASEIEAVIASGDRLAFFQYAYAFFFTKQGELRKKLLTKSVAEAHPDLVAALYDEAERLTAVEGRRRAVVICARSLHLAAFADAFLGAYRRLKAARQALDYDDLIRHAIALLEHSDARAWVLYKLDAGLSHILVDEAQDTSPEQWRVIAALSEEMASGGDAAEGRIRTLFAVGDDKQSIYSFQGAEPAAFAAMERHFGTALQAAGHDWRAIGLDTSFRSAPEVLQAVDAVFSHPEAAPGVTAPEAGLRHRPFRSQAQGLVELWPPVRAEDVPDTDPWDAPLDSVGASDPRSLLAKRIAETIRSWLKRGESLAGDPSAPGGSKPAKPIAPGDILILVRRRDAFVGAMIKALKEAGVPTAGRDRLVLTDQLVIQDLMALGRFALLPDDDLNLSAVLRGPLFGVSEEALEELCLGRPGTVWRALRDRADTPAWAGTHHRLSTIRARADRMTPFEFFTELLNVDGLRQACLRRLGPDADEAIDGFLGLAQNYERQRPPALQGFLHWVETGAAERRADTDKSRGEVRIMTVHGSKGLQANVVFLADTCQVPDHRTNPLSYKLKLGPGGEGEVALIWPAGSKEDDPVTSRLRAADDQTRAEEYRRLLYVAMTRARDRLYVCGYEGKRSVPGAWHGMVSTALTPLAGEIALPWGETGWRLGTPPLPAPPLPAPAHPDRADGADGADGTPAGGLPAWTQRRAAGETAPVRHTGPSQLAAVLRGAADPARLSPRVTGTPARRFRGIVIHKLLQHLPDEPKASWAVAGRKLLERHAATLEPGARDALWAEIWPEVEAVLGHPDLAPAFGPGSRAEVPLAGTVPGLEPGLIIDGQVDRLHIGTDRITVVDYKTNRPPPSELAKVPRSYLVQMAAYRALLQQIAGARPVSAVLVWTHTATVMPLPEAVLGTALEGEGRQPDL